MLHFVIEAVRRDISSEKIIEIIPECRLRNSLITVYEVLYSLRNVFCCSDMVLKQFFVLSTIASL